MALEIRKAVRRALPLQIAFFGPEGSGKTMSALLFAAGLAGPNGKVAVIDTERGRASLYADNKRVMATLPQGYDVLELEQPYSPARFIQALDVVEAQGYKVCLIDSSSDSWNGPGGCEDIAEASGGMWNKAKLLNKKFMTRIKLSDMHVICCLKAQEKTKIIEGAVNPRTGKKTKEFVDLGIQPICEKNFFYPMLLAFSVDQKTHLATAKKGHEDLAHLFAEPKLITKEDGEKVRAWQSAGVAIDPNELLRKRSRAAAEDGMDAYKAFFSSLTAAQKQIVQPIHDENKSIASDVDRAAKEGQPGLLNQEPAA